LSIILRKIVEFETMIGLIDSLATIRLMSQKKTLMKKERGMEG